MSRVAIEAFPEEINKRISSLIFLKEYNLITFELTIENKLATLRANFFSGETVGNSVFKIGFLCAIGYAKLCDFFEGVSLKTDIKLRPTNNTDLSEEIEDKFKDQNEKTRKLIYNMFHAVKLIVEKTIDKVHVCGNVAFS